MPPPVRLDEQPVVWQSMMVQRLPAIQKWSKTISLTVQKSIDILLQRRADLAGIQCVEDLFCEDRPGYDARLTNLVSHHLLVVRTTMARELWTRKIFIGVSVLDELLFRAIAHTDTLDPVLVVLEAIRDNELHAPGFILFPVHSFGVAGGGFLDTFTPLRAEYIDPHLEIGFTPQTNNFEGTIEFLEKCRGCFGISKSLPVELLQHWSRSRPTKWMTRNPLIISRFRSYPGSYYENQFPLTLRLKIATSWVLMMATLPKDCDPEDDMWCSSMVNNFETLDIHHYIVFFPEPNTSRLKGNCVPINATGRALAEICDLNVKVNIGSFQRQQKMGQRIHNALAVLESKYLQLRFSRAPESVLARVINKLLAAVDYFRRSIPKTHDDWAAVISLAIAFETLLMDNYGKEIKPRLKRRAALALRGVMGDTSMVDSVVTLYTARGGLVHKGSTSEKYDLDKARQAFVYAFLHIVEKLSFLPEISPCPIGDILGDISSDAPFGIQNWPRRSWSIAPS